MSEEMSNGISDGVGTKRKLRLITYLCPGIPLTLFQIYQEYLEEVLGCESYLLVEARWSGPPKSRVDPFTSDEADIGFVCSTSFLRLQQEKREFMEFLPVAPIHLHDKSEGRPVYFGDLIINKSKIDQGGKYNDFKDLMGHRLAYNDEESLSGNIGVLCQLKKMGQNASFFGDIIQSGSHLASIQMVLDGRVDTASIDSHALKLYLKDHPEYVDQIHVLCSLGPFPIQPIVVNARLPAELKEKIRQALLDMNKTPEWNEKLAQFYHGGFQESSIELYNAEVEIQEYVKSQRLRTIYY